MRRPFFLLGAAIAAAGGLLASLGLSLAPLDPPARGGAAAARRSGRGWSNRKVQRMAAKRRNQLRARRAGRR